MLFGAPRSVYYTANSFKPGIATFTSDHDLDCSIAFTYPAPHNGGGERTMIVSETGNQIIIENNIRIKQNGNISLGAYGNVPDYFVSSSDQSGKYWEP